MDLSDKHQHKSFSDFFDHQVRRKKFARQNDHSESRKHGWQKLDEDGHVFISKASDEATAFQELLDNSSKEIATEFSKYIAMKDSGKKKIDFAEYLTIDFPRLMPEILRDVMAYLATWFYDEPSDRETINR